MLFSSITFLFAFLLPFFLIYYLLPSRLKNFFLLLAGFVYLAWGSLYFLLILMLSIQINFMLGQVIYQTENQKSRKYWLLVAVTINLLALLIFKYSLFFSENINPLLSRIHVPLIQLPKILLPLGISFYTFRILSYHIETYRGKTEPEHGILSFALYVAYFPQLIAGPLVGFQSFYKQTLSRKHHINRVSMGLQRFMLGLAKKVLLANNLGLMADAVFNLEFSQLTLSTSWVGIMAYSLQIYFDFSAYTDMAIGLSGMLGFSSPENFNFPYRASSVSDFWKRWHMTLTQWFRNYLFLPIAFHFSRKLPKYKYWRIKTDTWIYAISISITWFLVGFWHGASWTFIVWGLLYAFFLILEQVWLKRRIKKWPAFLRHFYALLIITVAWVFFRADSFSQGFAMLGGMSGFNGLQPEDFAFYKYFTPRFITVFIIAILGAAGVFSRLHLYLGRLGKLRKTYRVVLIILLLLGFLFSVADMLQSTYSPFIYFKF